MAISTESLTLYHFRACPYCVRVYLALNRYGISIQMKNTRKDEAFRRELLEGGGKTQVPCLRIEHEDGTVEWMYESLDIVRFLKEEVHGSRFTV